MAGRPGPAAAPPGTPLRPPGRRVGRRRRQAPQPPTRPSGLILPPPPPGARVRRTPRRVSDNIHSILSFSQCLWEAPEKRQDAHCPILIGGQNKRKMSSEYGRYISNWCSQSQGGVAQWLIMNYAYMVESTWFDFQQNRFP